MKSLYLINPRADFPTYFSADYFEAWGLARAAQMADLAIPSLATLAAKHLNVTLCDEAITDVDECAAPDIVGITGKISQFQNIKKWATHFRRCGRLVVIGGSLASLSPELVRPYCDVLVRGEVEEIADQLFADLAAGNHKDEYQGGRPDMSLCSVPRWDLYPNGRALLGTVQTSRGCPFQCEFCDVIQYVGRKQRHKPIALVLDELDLLYQHGYRSIFLADDNFTVYRARARELLIAIRHWNQRQTAGHVKFYTQLSIEIARDAEMLDLCAQAGLTTVFIGIETPNEDSLREAGKRQNLRTDLVQSVAEFLAHGIQVVGGMIVGFDADTASVFQTQLDFAQASGIPTFSVGALVAPAATPLRARLAGAGRLRSEGAVTAAVPWSTNIVHPTLSNEALISGLQWLVNNLYHPEQFGDRLITFIDKLGHRRDPQARENLQTRQLRPVELESFGVVSRLKSLGQSEAELWGRIMRELGARREATQYIFEALAFYMQVRLMLKQGSFWEPQLAEAPPPDKSLITLTRRPQTGERAHMRGAS